MGRHELRLADAVAFATDAHSGKIYRGYEGRPDEEYIRHPMRVMRAVSREAQVVAVLHDCMEDAGRLPDWLTPLEREALDLLTRRKGSETYEEYIARIANSAGEAKAIAREVKLADLRDHLAHDPPPALRMRYLAALAALGAEA
jgi:hypothetical protein